MYHTSTENQLFNIKKSFLTKGFSSKDLQTYIADLTRLEQQIAHHILGFRNKPSVKLLNASIAKKIGCNVRTVIRATNKFHEDGFITKHQPEPYDANIYSFNEKVKKGPDAFSYWLNNLPEKSKDTYITNGIFIDHKNKKIVTQRNVTPYLSSLILESLFKKSSPLFTRARERDQSFSQKIKGKMMNPVMKPYGDSSTQETKQQKRIYSDWESPKELPIEQRREDLKRKIERCRMKLADPHKYIKYGVMQASIVFWEKDLQNHLRELEEIGSSNEKQSISCQYTSDSMAAYSS